MAIDYLQAASLNLPSGLGTQQLRQKLNNLVINPSYVKIYLKYKDISYEPKDDCMEALRQQVTVLSQQVEALYKLIENLNEKLLASATETKLTQQQRNDRSGTVGNDKTSSYPSYSSLDGLLEHKDILLDDSYFDKNSQSLEKELSAEIQIQRLTAQLTAAYNRIAALEEQLLSKRMHSQHLGGPN
ncbi:MULTISPECIES: hypothetical protein [unclassified Microcoleus]|uniref:hypothetical protein n=1 Tax=unclassified Microcoleus TaxID=2642155 RepID=UPI002FD29D4E